MSSIDTFKLRYPEFAALSEEVCTDLIQDAASQHNADFLGAQFEPLTLLLAAHQATVRQRSLAAASPAGGSGLAVVGGLQSVSTGQASVGYGGSAAQVAGSKMSAADAALATTLYGQEYIRRRDQLLLGALAAR
jgi:hypothetical protein